MSAPATQPPRMFALDVLRGVAVLLVIVFHAGARDLFPEPRTTWMRVTDTCWAGVDLFFVLSGFLISGLLFKEIDRTGTLKLGRFWLRRGFKIWPSYFAAYGAMVLLTCLYHARLGAWARVKTELVHALPNVVMVQNYFPGAYRWPNSWSLAIEEHFYLALPTVLLALLAARGKTSETDRFPRFFVGGAVFCVLVLVLRLVDAGRAAPNAYFPTHLRADSLCFGVMLGWAYRYRRAAFDRVARFWPIALVVAPIALVSIVFLGSPWPGYPPEPGEPPHSGNYLSGFTVGFTILYLASGSLVVAAGAHPDAGLRGPWILRAPLKALAFVGTYSYTIYLAQAIVPRTPGYSTAIGLARRLHDSHWPGRLLFVGVSLVLGIVLAHLVERPMLKLRERWLPSTRHGAG